MREYLDHNNKKLEIGFYLPLMVPNDFELFYFTGNYDNDVPIFKHEEKNIEVSGQLDEYIIKRLVRVSNKSVVETIENLKNKTNWLEEKLKE
jgi:hypothetical protein